MKSGFRLYICLLLTIVICTIPVNEVRANERLYVSSYSENDMLDILTYDDIAKHYLTLIDNENKEWCVNVTVTIEYEYSDGEWAKIKQIYVNVSCRDGYSVDVSIPYIYSTYGIRYIMIQTPDNRSIEYAIKGYADCYGDTEVYYEIVNR